MSGALKVPSERDNRGYHDEFVDQHGRRFAAEYDTRNNRPIGELRPVDTTPPWTPPMRFITWEREKGFRFRWDYDTMASELAGLTAAYYDDAMKVATSLPGDVPIPEPGGVVDRRIRAILGQPSLSPAIPLAAKHGDQWLLGFSGATPSEEIKLVVQQGLSVGANEILQIINQRITAQIKDPAPAVAVEPVDDKSSRVRSITDVDVPDPAKVTYRDFLAGAIKAGMTMAEGAKAWADHKAFLAASEPELVEA